MQREKLLLAVSDVHGNFDALHQVMLLHPQVDGVVFLGDGMREFEDIRSLYPRIPMMGVPGNCDYGCPDHHTKIYFWGGRKLMLTHGHYYHVKEGLDYLAQAAISAGAAVALYGHTHCQGECQRDGVWCINPGSLGMSREYALLRLENQALSVQLCRLP